MRYCLMQNLRSEVSVLMWVVTRDAKNILQAQKKINMIPVRVVLSLKGARHQVGHLPGFKNRTKSDSQWFFCNRLP